MPLIRNQYSVVHCGSHITAIRGEGSGVLLHLVDVSGEHAMLALPMHDTSEMLHADASAWLQNEYYRYAESRTAPTLNEFAMWLASEHQATTVFEIRYGYQSAGELGEKLIQARVYPPVQIEKALLITILGDFSQGVLDATE